jgi:DNA-binding ferritin-like protein
MTDHFGDLHKMVPERIELSQRDFDALVERLDQPGQYDPRVAKVLSTPAPWDEGCDKTSTPEKQ